VHLSTKSITINKLFYLYLGVRYIFTSGEEKAALNIILIELILHLILHSNFNSMRIFNFEDFQYTFDIINLIIGHHYFRNPENRKSDSVKDKGEQYSLAKFAAADDILECCIS